MKKIVILILLSVIMMLTACQVNNVRDTGGGSVSPSSTVTGISMGSDNAGNL